MTGKELFNYSTLISFECEECNLVFRLDHSDKTRLDIGGTIPKSSIQTIINLLQYALEEENK
jgi:hypothetical protein